MLVFLALVGCGASDADISDGYDQGCEDGQTDGADWGYADAFSCLERNDQPSPRSDASSAVGIAYVDGYEDCFPDAYTAGYDDFTAEFGDCS